MQMGIMANVNLHCILYAIDGTRPGNEWGAIDAAAPGNERSAVDGPVPQNGAKGSKEISHV